MNVCSSGRARAKSALRRKFGGSTDANGYVNWPDENLVSGVRLAQCESDLREGDGGELRMKFCAVHSSAALAVNAFAPFKDRPEDLDLLGERGALSIRFEKQMPIVPGRRPSNLDVWIDRQSTVVGVESKFLEYFVPKRPEFAEAYTCMQPPTSEECWWSIRTAAEDRAPRQLDVAQLVKHYFGLRRFEKSEAQRAPRTILLYLFWEPANWREIEECLQHRRELLEFQKLVAGSSTPFHWMPYAELWHQWLGVPHLAQHARHLTDRYTVSI